MIIILMRTIILYLIVLVSIRLMGKGELAEMQPFELVITLMIAELAALPMEDTAIPLINGVVAITTLFFIQVMISFINLKSEKARRIICGRPSILINKGKINEFELKKLRININDLVEQIRAKDYPNMDDIEFAILETNGDLSIIPKSNKRPVVLEDLNIIKPYDGLPVSLILDGHINDENLLKIGYDRSWLNSQLEVHGVTDSKEVLFCFRDATEKLYIQKKDSYKDDYS